MAQGKATTQEDKKKVIEAKLKNPELSTRDIEQLTGVGRETNRNIINEELPELMATSDKGEQMIAKLDSIINDIAEMTSLSMANFKEKVLAKELGVKDIKDLNDIAKNNFDRKQLLQGKATSNVDILGYVLKDIQGQSGLYNNTK